MVYNVEHVCRYHDDSLLFLEAEREILSEEEKDIVRREIYQDDFCILFGIPTEGIDDEYNLWPYMKDLCKRLLDCEPIKECMRLSAASISKEEDLELGLCLLYSYDYMHLTHSCVQSFLKNEAVDTRTLVDLLGRT